MKLKVLKPGADPGWSVRGGIEVKIGRKGADFARFWPILEGAAPHAPLLDLLLETSNMLVRTSYSFCLITSHIGFHWLEQFEPGPITQEQV